MTPINHDTSTGFEILVAELMADDELRDSFLRDPDGTLRLASDWAIPLCDSELHSLETSGYRLRDKVVEELEARFSAVA